MAEVAVRVVDVLVDNGLRLAKVEAGLEVVAVVGRDAVLAAAVGAAVFGFASALVLSLDAVDGALRAEVTL